MPNELIEIIGVLIGLSLIVYAMYCDIRTREVENHVWLIGLALVIPLLIIRIFFYWENWDLMGAMIFSIFLGGIIGLLIAILGIWGGADVKGFWFLCLASPLQFWYLGGDKGIITQVLREMIPISLSIIMNAVVLTIPLPFIIFGMNMWRRYKWPKWYTEVKLSLWQQLYLGFVAYPLPVETIRKKHKWSYAILEEKSENQWKICLQMATYVMDDDEELALKEKVLTEAEADGKKTIWISYSIPFIVFLGMGYFIAVFWGNLLLRYWFGLFF